MPVKHCVHCMHKSCRLEWRKRNMRTAFQILLDRLLANNKDEEVGDEADNCMVSNPLVTTAFSDDSSSHGEVQYATENEENVREWSKKYRLRMLHFNERHGIQDDVAHVPSVIRRL
ncbi:hypothetical protein KIN20_020013 [Parelaphostrongylus tenuis]|uniref:Uncharacterized protein n=1 Tax=Parelaphostrongylus tenuis TaxID=148309 RepID=A0AAD5MLV8_PARTN|nr:hypothetical protein KIN20_020013 [Parelaphostrongylus tenuis]